MAASHPAIAHVSMTHLHTHSHVSMKLLVASGATHMYMLSLAGSATPSPSPPLYTFPPSTQVGLQLLLEPHSTAFIARGAW